jgi:UDP-N-acetyl-D-galactosamine dehydrogenase
MSCYAAQNVIRLMLKNGINLTKATVGILGITFKENCPDVRNSKVIDMAREFESWGLQVKIMDPLASAQEVLDEYNLRLTQITPNAPVDSLVIAVAHTQFAQMTPFELKSLCAPHGKVVIADLKSIFNKSQLEDAGFVVFRL